MPVKDWLHPGSCHFQTSTEKGDASRDQKRCSFNSPPNTDRLAMLTVATDFGLHVCDGALVHKKCRVGEIDLHVFVWWRLSLARTMSCGQNCTISNPSMRCKANQVAAKPD